MGIKHFFYWWKTQFKVHIKNVNKHHKLKTDNNVNIDVLLLDLNGIFHKSAQKIFKYGSSTESKSLLTSNTNTVENNSTNRNLVYKDICDNIANLVDIVQPNKSVILCTDGPAPIGKQYQQRQRRFRGTLERNSDDFDSNCITPGTIFMDELSEYIHTFLIDKKRDNDDWKNLHLVFSDEKVPGEGEHKAINYVKENGLENDTFCINGPDADLIMLALSTHKENFYILRDDMFGTNNDFFCIDIKQCKQKLLELLKWESSDFIFLEKNAINDFIFICFLVGNDFLPHVPSIEIIEEGIEMMINIYTEVSKVKGHFTYFDSKNNVRINLDAFKSFMNIIGRFEEQNFAKKINAKCFKDEMMQRHLTSTFPTCSIDVKGYINDYNKEKFENETETVCHKYIQGLQWVLTYYTSSVPSWNWYFPFQYAPMASEIYKYVDTYKQPRYGKTTPSLPFVQLLSVLPPRSSDLVAKPLDDILKNPSNSLKQYFPDEIKIDLSGKRKEWEGVTIVPMIDVKKVKREYSKIEDQLSTFDKKRNRINDVIII